MLHCRSVSHQNTPLAIREKLDLTTQSQIEWLLSLENTDAVILSTCNRLELYAAASSSAAMDSLWEELLEHKGIAPESVAPYVIRRSNFEAANHLFHVAGSLRSMAIGESQIIGQVAAALEQAEKCGTCGHRMSLLFRAALHAAKRIRAETRIGFGNVSLSSLGIRKVEQLLGSLTAHSIVVIGAGEMGQAVIKGLNQRRIADIQLVSRTFETAKQTAETWGIQARPLTHLKDLLTAADVVFTTSSAPFPILSAEDIKPVMAARGQRDLYIVDIAVPRDVAPDVTAIAGVHLFDLDSLNQVIAANHHEREQAIPQAQRIIDEELAKFWQDYQGLAAVPTIRQIRAQANQIREQELQRIYNKLNGAGHEELTPLFEEFSHRFMNKILHQPTQNLRKKAGQANSAQFTSVARDLFGIDES